MVSPIDALLPLWAQWQGSHDGSMPSPLMPSQIKTETNGATSAFTSDNRLVMNMGHPTISTYLRIKEMQEWMTTLEEVMLLPRIAPHLYHLEGMYFAFKVAIKHHKKEHLEVVTEAPSEKDLEEYLASYAIAISKDAA